MYNLAFSQDAEIIGVVFDDSNGETIPLVNIIKLGSSIGTTSTENGKYSLKLGAGTHQIQFSNLTYRDTVLTLVLEENERRVIDVYLKEDRLLLDEIVVSADRVTRVVQKLAYARDKLNSDLTSYRADIYKLAILGTKANRDTSISKLNAIAFSERYATIQHILKPERYSEIMMANRASKNFFSEYDFFSTGGPPLNLNQDLVPLSILSEDITVIGPISGRAGRFYYLDEADADSTWPAGTMEISVSPKIETRPLFKGKIWYNPESQTILGVDVALNEYASTNTGLFSISDLNYQQNYAQIGKYWLPERTTLSAQLKFMVSSNPIVYNDEWTWSKHQVNPQDLKVDDLDLNTVVILPNSHRKKSTFWDSLSVSSPNENLNYLTEAQNYTEKNRTLRLGMSFMSSFFRLPYQLERFYLTNISDLYHFNRVEGHTIGLGIRTPVHSNYEYRTLAAYGFSSNDITYSIKGFHFIPGTAFAPDFRFYREVALQYQDYEYNRTPLDFYEFRQTLGSLIVGNAENNYFLREGYSVGLRYRFDIESFFRVLYIDENHLSLSANTAYNLFGNDIDGAEYQNNDPMYFSEPGTLNGLSLHLHYDTRKYLRTQFLRDYNIRDFGWLIDATLEKGVPEWGSYFYYNRYRVGIKFNMPVFSSHFIQTDLIIGASNKNTPGQRMFSFNGFVVDDYIRERPFNTISFKDPVVNRVSILKVKYKFGSSITRKIPIAFIQKSGIHLATFLTAGSTDLRADLMPLIPSKKSKNQVEIGFAAFKIFGFMYVEYSRRLVGEYGNTMGFQILF